mgnify:CR=1 FL=1
MNDIYGSLDGNIRSINVNDENCSYNLNEYYVKTAYNACSGGNYKNDIVEICNLKAVLKQGVRGLDFEIYSIDDKPVVATSTSDNYYIKETYNSVDFNDVMNTIQNYAFSASTSPNPTDPILIHLRFMSNNQSMYSNLANIFKSYDTLLLGKEYSYETAGHNLGGEPLLNFMNKVILIFDRSNTAFLENKDLMEYVNMTSNSIFMRAYSYYDVKNNPDLDFIQELGIIKPTFSADFKDFSIKAKYKSIFPSFIESKSISLIEQLIVSSRSIKALLKDLDPCFFFEILL